MKKIEELKEELSNILNSKGVIVDSITVSKKGKYNFLTIELDKIGGINLDEIVEATEIINPIVDKYDICDDTYILDVISKERGDING